MTDQIQIWTQDHTEAETRSAMPGFGLQRPFKTVAVEKEKLQASIKKMIADFGGLLEQGTEGYEVSEIELALSVNASGGVELLGKAEVGAEASVKVKITRRAEGRETSL